MRLARPPAKPKREGTIALINIVFLMLIFFLIAGTLAPPMDRVIKLIQSGTGEPVPPPQALFVREDGSLSSGGQETSLEQWLAGMGGDSAVLRLFADRRTPARLLIETAARVEARSGKPVRLVTLKAQP
ncbi:MAG: biopolymer transporter ExbD [Pseudomonadota bacterium]